MLCLYFEVFKQLLYHNVFSQYKPIVFVGCSKVMKISCKVKEKLRNFVSENEWEPYKLWTVMWHAVTRGVQSP